MRHLRVALVLTALLFPVAITAQASAATSDPVVISHGNGTEDVFVRGSDNHLWHAWFGQGGWHAWEDLGGDVRGNPAAISYASNHMDVLIRDANDYLTHRYWNGTAWSPWTRLGSWRLGGDPEVVSWSYGREDVFAQGLDSALIHAWSSTGSPTNDGWSEWESLGGGIIGKPSAVSWYAGHLDVFVRGYENHIWHKFYTPSAGWSAYQLVGNWIAVSEPAAVAPQNGAIDVFTVGTDSAMNHNWFGTGGWQPEFSSLAGVVTNRPEVLVPAAGHEDAFITSTGGAVYHKWFPSSNGDWSDWTRIGAWNVAGNISSVSWSASHEDIFGRGTDGQVIHSFISNGVWQAWASLGDPTNKATWPVDPWAMSNMYDLNGNGFIETSQEITNFQNAWNASSAADRQWAWDHLRPEDRDRMWWFAAYPTSWHYGGTDHSVNLDSEFTDLQSRLDGSSYDQAAVLFNGLTPSDQSAFSSWQTNTAEATLSAQGALAGDVDGLGVNVTGLSGFAAPDATATTASAGTQPCGPGKRVKNNMVFSVQTSSSGRYVVTWGWRMVHDLQVAAATAGVAANFVNKTWVNGKTMPPANPKFGVSPYYLFHARVSTSSSSDYVPLKVGDKIHILNTLGGTNLDRTVSAVGLVDYSCAIRGTGGG